MGRPWVTGARLTWVWVDPRRSLLWGKSSQRMHHTSPMEPVQIKAACQPQRMVTAAIRMGAMKADALEPELNRPVAKARSSEGNHSVVALIAAGKLPDS